MAIFARSKTKERCRSGRSGRTRNAVYGQLYRGSNPLSAKWQQEATDFSVAFFSPLSHLDKFTPDDGTLQPNIALSRKNDETFNEPSFLS